MQELRHARQQIIADRVEKAQENSSKWAKVEMKADSWLYIGLGLGAVGLVVTVVGLGDKGFQTLELKVVGPSVIGLGILVSKAIYVSCILTQTDLNVDSSPYAEFKMISGYSGQNNVLYLCRSWLL